MKLISIFLLLVITICPKAQCLDTDPNQYNISWQAFKTYKKIGVKGRFKKVELLNISKNTKFNTSLKAVKLKIQTSSLSTDNDARDKNLKDYFFNFPEINSELIKIDKEFITLKMTINKKSKTIPLKYKLENNNLEASGFIDILDFGLSEQLSSLNKQCYSLHEAKTWSDVEIFFETKLVECK